MIGGLRVSHGQAVLRSVHANTCAFDRLAIVVENPAADVTVRGGGRDWLSNSPIGEAADAVYSRSVIARVDRAVFECQSGATRDANHFVVCLINHYIACPI